MSTKLESRTTSRVLFVLFVFLTIFTVLSIRDLQNDAKESARQVTVASERQDKAEAAAKALTEQVEDLGGRPVIDPEDLERALENRSGTAPSAADVSFAVQLYCADGRCNGKEPTISQVAAAVATYCDNRGQCRGKQGEKGEDGETIVGPPPSAESVLAAVTTYCDSHDGCRGPKGDSGTNGTNGTDGRNGVDVVKVECNSDQKFVMFYSNGDSQVVENSDCVAGGGPVDPPGQTP